MREYPNIIIVMEESFWDSHHLENGLPKDLLSFVHQNQVSNLLSPSFGGVRRMSSLKCLRA